MCKRSVGQPSDTYWPQDCRGSLQRLFKEHWAASWATRRGPDVQCAVMLPSTGPPWCQVGSVPHVPCRPLQHGTFCMMSRAQVWTGILLAVLLSMCSFIRS